MTSDSSSSSSSDDEKTEAIRRSKKSLFEDDSEGAEEKQGKLKINRKYANAYEARKQKEELRQVKFSGLEDDDSSSSSSSEDEVGDLTTDVDFIKTINALRSKDASIYDPSKRFFQEKEESDGTDDDEKKPKAKHYKDLVREQVLEKMEREERGDEEEEESDEDDRRPLNRKANLAYDDEQREIRKAFLQSTADSSDDEEVEDLLTVKKKHKPNEDNAELQAEMEKLEQARMQQPKDVVVDPRGEVKDGEQFLFDFFKNRNWIDRENDSDDGLGDGDQDAKVSGLSNIITGEGGKNDDDDDTNSLEQLERTDDFEAEYNFRFEEAAAATTVSGADFSNRRYARNSSTSLRRPDTTRRDKRLARQERKALKRKEKEEELKRLKNAKRKELERKLTQVQSVLGGLEERGASVDEASLFQLLEGDFDPDKFEAQMSELYGGEDFHNQEDAEWKTDQDVRNSLRMAEDGDLLIGANDDDEHQDGDLYDGAEEDEGDAVHDGAQGEWADGEEEWPDEECYGNDEAAFEKASREESALSKKVRERMMDELYKLDYEDIVAGQPTRFKYRQVTPNSFGLSTEEILLARDTSLKQFVSLKKMAPYSDEEYRVTGLKRRRFREKLRQDILEQQQEEEEAAKTKESSKNDKAKEEGAAEQPVGSRAKRKRRRMKKGQKGQDSSSDKQQDIEKESDTEVTKQTATKTEEETRDTKGAQEDGKSRKRKRRRKGKRTSDADEAGTTGENKSELPTTKHEAKGSTAAAESIAPVVANKGVTSSSSEVRTDDKKQAATKEPTRKADRKKEKSSPASSSQVEDKKKKRKQEKSARRKERKAALMKGLTKPRLASYGL